MPDDAFLDTGVVLGFCFTLDKHHLRCKGYVSDCNGDLFYSDTVESEYQNRRYGIIEELSDKVRIHRGKILKSDYEGLLDQLDLKEIQDRFIHPQDDISTPLRDWYDDLGNSITVEELTERLETLAREIEKYSMARKQALENNSTVWTTDEPVDEVYDGLWQDLDCIPGDDRKICLEAHDVTVERGTEIAFATVNPQDFVDDEADELVCSKTGICEVVDLAIRG